MSLSPAAFSAAAKSPGFHSRSSHCANLWSATSLRLTEISCATFSPWHFFWPWYTYWC